MSGQKVKEPAPEKKMEQTIHLPDRQFCDWCLEVYAINRGVLNVIDSWFFETGIENIIKRRRTIVQFLKYLQTKDLNHANKKHLYFGKGGVKKSLQYFVQDGIQQN